MQVTLTFVRREQKTSKANKPYTSFSIKTKEHGDQYLSGFGNKKNELWAVGDTVDIEVEEKKVGDKTYLNWNMPKLPEGYSFQNEDIVFIKTVLGRIISKLEAIEETVGAKPKVDNYPPMTEKNNGEFPF